MRSRMLRKTTALLMTMLLVLTTVLSAMPVYAQVGAQTDMLPGTSATVRATDGVTAVSTDDAITVTATAAGKAVITPDGTSIKTFNMTTFNGLSMAVSSTADFKLSLTFFSTTGFTSVTLSSADGDFNRMLPQNGAYIPAGTNSGVMNVAQALSEKSSAFDAKAQASVYLRSITVETDKAATVTISKLDMAQYSENVGTSLLTGTQAIHAGSVNVKEAANGYELSTADGYAAIRFSTTVKASLFANLHYNFTVENAASNVEKSTFTVYVKDASGTERDFKLNTAITGNSDADAAITAGHYEGSVSMSNVKAAYEAYCAKVGNTVQDIVDDGMITITGIKVHLSITGGGNVDVYNMSVSEPEAVKPDLMPSAAQIAEKGIATKDGWIVFKGNANDTISYDLDLYYNIGTYNYIAANVNSNTTYDIIVQGEGAGTSSNNKNSSGVYYSSDSLGKINTSNDADWGDKNFGVSTNGAAAVVSHKFYGSPDWNGRINANDMYHITKVTIKLKAAGTLKISALRMTSSSDLVLSQDDVTFTVGTAEGKAGDIVNVPVYLDSVSGVANFDMFLSFDNALLTPVTKADGTCAEWNKTVAGSSSWKVDADQGNGTVKLVYASSKNSAAGGQLFYIPFMINKNAGVVATPVTVKASNVQVYGDLNADSFGAMTPNVKVESGMVLIGCDDPSVTNISVSTTTATTTTTAAPANVMVSVVTVSETVKADDVIAVDVMINGESGLSNFTMDVCFDNTKLTPVAQNEAWAEWNNAVLGNAVSAEGNEELDDALTAANYNAGDNAVRLAFVTARRNTAAEGKLATLYFKVNSDIVLKPTAVADIEVNIIEAKYYDAQVGYRNPVMTTADTSVTVYPTLTLEFYSDGGELITTEKIVNYGDDIDTSMLDVAIPKMLNYAAIGWEIVNSASTASVKKLVPIYGYTVETVNGTITDASVMPNHWIKENTMAYFNERHAASESILGYNNSATIVANAAPAGQKFSHWADQYNNIVSYEETYTIFVPGNLTLTAVYVDKSVEIVKAPTVAMQVVRGVYDEATSKASITWVCDLNDEFDEETYTVTEAGIIYGVSGTSYDDLKNEVAGKTKRVAVERVSAVSHQYSVTIAGVKDGYFRQAIAYATYTKTDGSVVTVYSAPAAVIGMTSSADM